MKMMLLDVQHDELKMVDVATLDDYYKHLDCRTIDIVYRRIGDKYYNIICDDEGLLTDFPQPSGIDVVGRVMLVGNLLIASGKTIDGELTSLTEDDVNNLLENVAHISTSHYKNPYMVFVEMDW